MYLELDTHKEFWQSLSIVCDDELETARRSDAIEKSKSTFLFFSVSCLPNSPLDKADALRFATNTGMHDAIKDDVQDISSNYTLHTTTKL